MIKLFSVWDSKAEIFGKPILAANRAVALRSFKAAVNSEGHEFASFSEDYTLFEVGSFDEQNGALQGEATPVAVALAATLVDHKSNES